jgi:hypothetical protein
MGSIFQSAQRDAEEKSLRLHPKQLRAEEEGAVRVRGMSSLLEGSPHLCRVAAEIEVPLICLDGGDSNLL